MEVPVLYYVQTDMSIVINGYIGNGYIGMDILVWLYLMTSRGTVPVLVLCYVHSDMSILHYPPFYRIPTLNGQKKVTNLVGGLAGLLTIINIGLSCSI
jgi:hypothetical protein